MKIFLLFLLVRLASVFLVQTSFVPDEYWQSLEVGHKLVFGQGFLTWEWTRGVRSYLYPLLVAGIYKILALLQLDQVELLLLLPRVAQALLSAYSDYRFYKWTDKSKWGAFVLCTSWFWFYTGSRTLSNTMEASLTVIALSYFPWRKREESTVFLWFVFIATFIRPTAIIPWIPLCFHHIKKSNYSAFELLFKRYLPIKLVVGAALVALDTYFYDKLIITPYEFFKVNVVEGIGEFYGKHPWYWYLNVGLPTILGITFVPFLFSVIQTLRNYQAYEQRLVLLTSVAVTLSVYSVLPHKEFRFLLQILPICLYLASDFLSRWSRKASVLVLYVVAITLLVGNLVPAGYLSYVHQRGTLDVMPVLRRLSSEYKEETGQNAKVLFLMPCHSTPGYSHLHGNATLRFLKCEPNFNHEQNYLDEADQFYKDPSKWIRSHIPVHPPSSLPSHLVLFDVLAPRISDFLSTYEPVETVFHADYVSGDNRIGKNVVVYERLDVTGSSKSKKANKETPKPPEQETVQSEQ
uniref:Mannosyltransferase n=1 Tax=Culicoides sonorensis TaxID=179676 RepID=A0A336MML2_CULSO